MPRLAAVDRATHAGADACERVELFDRRIRSVRDDGTGFEQRPVRVRAVGLAGPETIGEVPVRGSVRELHGRGYAERREAADVVGREQLRVLDPRAQPERLPGLTRRCEGVERLAVRPVADRVHRHGEARRCA